MIIISWIWEMLVVKKQYFWYRDSLVSFYYTISCHCRVVGRYYWGQWLLSLVGLVYSIECAPNEVYVNITKRSLLFAKEESFQLFGGDMLLYSSPLFEDNQEQVLEVCLPFSVSSLYCLKLLELEMMVGVMVVGLWFEIWLMALW